MDSTSPEIQHWIPTPPSAQAILLPIFGSISILLLLVPFYYHLSLKSIGPSCLIFCVLATNIFTVVNAILWPNDDYKNWWDGRGWCDIQGKVRWALVTGTNSSTMCLTRNLALMFDTDRQIVSPTPSMRRRKAVTDLAVCFGIPILQICLAYVIQDYRYYIQVLSGCAPSFDNSWPTIVIMYIWPLIFCFGNCYYAALVVIRLRAHRNTALSNLAAHSMPLPLFIRLLIMCLLLLFLYMPLNIFFFYTNLNITWLSYDWFLVHQNIDKIYYLPTIGERSYDHWFPIIATFFIILGLGLANDATFLYRRLLLRIPYVPKLFPCLSKPQGHHLRGSGRRMTESCNSLETGVTGDSRKGLFRMFSLTSRVREYFTVTLTTNHRGNNASHIGNSSQIPKTFTDTLITIDEIENQKQNEWKMSGAGITCPKCAARREGRRSDAGNKDGEAIGIAPKACEKRADEVMAVAMGKVVGMGVPKYNYDVVTGRGFGANSSDSMALGAGIGSAFDGGYQSELRTEVEGGGSDGHLEGGRGVHVERKVEVVMEERS